MAGTLFGAGSGGCGLWSVGALNRARATLYYRHFSEPQEASLLFEGGI